METVLLLLRMLLFRPARGGLVHWIQLLNESAVSSENHTQSVRRWRHAQDDEDEAKRAARAMSLVQVGDSQRPDKHWKALPWHHTH